MAVRYDLEHSARTRNKLIGLLATGMTYQSAADKMASPSLKVTPQSIHSFAQRHSTEIANRRQMLEQSDALDWIGDKTERIRKLASMYRVIDADLQQYGPRTTEVRTTDDDGTQTTIRYGGVALVQQARGILRDAAEELGQIERPSVNTNIQVNQFLVREYGVDNPDQV